MNQPPADFQTRSQAVENFLIEYLGSSRQPVPFGGRETELAALDNWLLDVQSPPYALISGPAGRGKSALLVRWADSLVKREWARVVFFPISIRFNTALKSALFSTLAAGLAEIYGEPVKQADLTAEQWQEVCLTYLKQPPPPGKPVVVILDGLDQIADWTAGPDMFPQQPASQVRVAVSVRSEAGQPDWLHQLGWNKVGLTDLTAAGVEAIWAAARASNGSIEAHDEIQPHLFRLSQGDPLILQLYLEALTPQADQPARLAADELTRLAPGLEGYIRHWGTTLRRRPHLIQAVIGLINLCALALGPLTRLDLLVLAPDIFKAEDLLDEALQAAGNFIIEDPVKQSYVFSHLRLGDFFRGHLSVEEQTDWQARFLRYGQETVAALERGDLLPKEVPAYVVQYYGAHLSRAGAVPQAFYALLTQPWLKAWQYLEHNYGGFLNDVERAWQQAEMEGQVPIQILCALIRASVATLSSNIHPLLLARAIQLDVITPAQALALARQKPEEAHYIRALIELIPYLPESLLPHVLAELKKASNSWKITALLKLVNYFSGEAAKQEVLQAAWEAALFFDDIFTQLQILHQLTLYRPELSDQQAAIAEQAMAKALTMPRHQPHDDSPKIGALSRITPYLPPEMQKRALLKAYNLAGEADDKGDRARFLVELAPQMPEEIKLDATRQALLAVIDDLSGRHARFLARGKLQTLASYLPDSLHKDAVAATKYLENPATRAQVLGVLLPMLAAPLQETALAQAVTALQQVEDNYDRVITISSLAAFLPEAEKPALLDQAVKLAQADTRPIPRARQLACLSLHLAEPLRTEFLREALALVLKFEYEFSQSEILSIFVSHLSRELLNEIMAKRSVADQSIRVKLLSGLTLDLASAGALDEEFLPVALEAVLALPQREGSDKSPQAEALITLAPHLPDYLRGQALAALRAMPQTGEDDKILRVKSLAGLLPYVPPHFRDETSQEILAEMRALPKGDILGKYRLELMVYLPQQLPEPFQTEAWQEALMVAQLTPFESFRASALIKLMPYLPDPLKETALRLVKGMAQEETQIKCVLALAPYLPDALWPEAFAIISAISTPYRRAEGWLGLAPYIPELWRIKILAEARTLGNGSRDYAKVLTGLWPHLPEALRPGVLEEILEVVRKFYDLQDKAEAITHLVPHLPETGQAEIVNEALTAIRRMGESVSSSVYDYPQARLVASLAPYLPAGQMQQDALAIIAKLSTMEARVEGWLGLVPYLPLSLQAEIVAAAPQIKTEYRCSDFLSGLMPHLPKSLQTQVVETALAFEDARVRAQTIVALAPYLPETLKTSALGEGLAAVKRIEEEWDRIELAGKFAPYLPESLWPELLSLSHTLKHRFFWKGLLEKIAPYMPDQVKADALRLTYRMDPQYELFKPLAIPLAEWARVQPEAASAAWQPMLRHLVTQSRRDILNALHDLMPFILALGGKHEPTTTAADIFQVIKKIEAWWP